MATMKISRNIILSLKDFFESYISGGNYDFTFTSAWVEDDKIVKPSDYVENQGMVKLPAGKMTVLTGRQGDNMEIGGGSQYKLFHINFFIHTITEGQLYDLLDLLSESLTDGVGTIGDKIITIKDFSLTGYPSDSAPDLFTMEILNVNQKTVFNLDEQNIALRFAGSISFMGKILRHL